MYIYIYVYIYIYIYVCVCVCVRSHTCFIPVAARVCLSAESARGVANGRSSLPQRRGGRWPKQPQAMAKAEAAMAKAEAAWDGDEGPHPSRVKAAAPGKHAALAAPAPPAACRHRILLPGGEAPSRTLGAAVLAIAVAPESTSAGDKDSNIQAVRSRRDRQQHSMRNSRITCHTPVPQG